MRRREQKAIWPVATLNTELQEAVLVEATKFRARCSVAQTGASESSVAPPAEARTASAAARNAGRAVSPSADVNQLLKGIRHWVDTLSETDRSLAPVCRIREALDVLELDGSRNARPRVQKLLKACGTTQKESSYHEKSAADAHKDLRTKVFAECNRLRTKPSISRQSSFDDLFRQSSADMGEHDESKINGNDHVKIDDCMWCHEASAG